MELAPESAKPCGQLEGRAGTVTTVETPSWSGYYCSKPNKQGQKTSRNPLNKTQHTGPIGGLSTELNPSMPLSP